jgi:hypothetical protein
MRLTELLRWDEIDHSISLLRENSVIDCGHIAVRYSSGEFLFGGYDGPSLSNLETLEVGVALCRRMKSQGRKIILSICLSDTSRLLGDGSKRAELLSAIDASNWPVCLPPEYLSRLSASDLDHVTVTLQTRNSNRFSGLIKKVKARAMHGSSPEKLYEELYGVLLSSLDGDRFAVSTPFLMKCTEEDSYYGGSKWKGRDYFDREESLIARPMTRLKRSGLINLYEKSTGILCPSAYGGLLLNYDESCDHICIYSRRDDCYIGEKILRGVIVANILKTDFSRTCLQIVFPETSRTPELSTLNSAQLKQPDVLWSAFVSWLEKHGIFDHMSFYRGQTETEVSLL